MRKKAARQLVAPEGGGATALASDGEATEAPAPSGGGDSRDGDGGG